MIESTSIYNALLLAAVDTALDLQGHTIIGDNEFNPPAPSGEYATVTVVNSLHLGTPAAIHNTDLTVINEQFMTSIFSIIFNRGEPNSRAATTRSWLMSQLGRALFRSANAGLVTCSSIRNISVSLPHGREKRAQLDITLSYIDTLLNVSDVIDTLTINGVYYGDSLVKEITTNA